MFKFQPNPILQYSKQLVKLEKRLLPLAVRMSLNDAVFATDQKAKMNINQRMIIRNKWTVGGMRFEKACGYNIDNMNAVIGNIRDYMALQETGGDVEKKSAKYPVPTLQSRIRKSYQKPIALRFRMNKLGDLSEGSNNEKFYIGRTKKRNRLAIMQRMKRRKKIKVIRLLVDKPKRIKATNWMKDAIITENDLDKFFIKNAKCLIKERQFR